MIGYKQFLRFVIFDRTTKEWLGIYQPEQIVFWGSAEDEELKKMIFPLDAVAEYFPPELFIKPIERENKESLKKVLLWLDEHLPQETVEKEGFLIEVEIFDKGFDVIRLAYPDDYERIKSGKRKRITELPQWQIHFGETNPYDALPQS